MVEAVVGQLGEKNQKVAQHTARHWMYVIVGAFNGKLIYISPDKRLASDFGLVWGCGGPGARGDFRCFPKAETRKTRGF